jgi:hypothetical protein
VGSNPILGSLKIAVGDFAVEDYAVWEQE